LDRGVAGASTSYPNNTEQFSSTFTET